jgi:hypothetical protein
LVSKSSQILKIKEEEKGIDLEESANSQRGLMTFIASEIRIEGNHKEFLKPSLKDASTLTLTQGNSDNSMNPFKQDEFQICFLKGIDCFYTSPKHPDRIKASILVDVISKVDNSVIKSDFKMKAFVEELRECTPSALLFDVIEKNIHN